MKAKVLSGTMVEGHQDLVGIFYDEARRLSPDEDSALSLTREAIRYFLKYYKSQEHPPSALKPGG